ncbi:YbaB/EbfC family nucleoid-associated protein [Mycoplasmopsis ciconiae]|uniref:Nucleoid-associated protein V2E24_03145 n=1 Tax=Mycoplasmopsis ciconiae TaxID=561067 RepID=A0ABU7MM30_9BACT|nr:YbaB/EbfC family nucleoid-associated protein [Mycoplasmopsis ciconiae]
MNAEMLKRLRKMQAEMERKQKELDKKEFSIEKQGIKVTMYGNLDLKSITIDEALIDPEDKDIIEELLVLAINELKEIVEEEQEKLVPQAPGNLPF